MNASISIHTMLLILRVVMRTIIVTPQPIVLLTARIIPIWDYQNHGFQSFGGQVIAIFII